MDYYIHSTVSPQRACLPKGVVARAYVYALTLIYLLWGKKPTPPNSHLLSRWLRTVRTTNLALILYTLSLFCFQSPFKS